MMVIGTDENVGLESQRGWRLIPVLAVVIPAVIFVGAVAWFIRAYVVPPMVTIADLPPPALVDQARAADWPPVLAPETTGSTSQPSAPSRPSAVNTVSFFPPAPAAASKPVAEPPSAAWPVPRVETNETLLSTGEPIAGPIPLPQPRPRLSLAIVRGPVPLPRPRPTN